MACATRSGARTPELCSAAGATVVITDQARAGTSSTNRNASPVLMLGDAAYAAIARGGAGAAQRLRERGGVEVEDKRVSCEYVHGRNLSVRVEERIGSGGTAWSTGVSLSKDLMAIAGGALKTNITTLHPLVLPFSELLLFFATLAAKKLFNAMVKPYIPDFQIDSPCPRSAPLSLNLQIN